MIHGIGRGLLAGYLSTLIVCNPGSAWADGHGAPTSADAQPSRKGVDQTLSLIREASLALLKEGNQRYAAGQSRHPNQDAARRSLTVSDGQKPFASILACSDSRSPVEVIFDRGVGELFVIRVVGNVADETQIATIEYGVEHLGTPLLVVLGHTGCGAVGAACKGGSLPGHLPALIRRIQPAVDKARAVATTPERLIPTAIQANVWVQIEEVVFQSSIVREKLKEGALQIVGGVYDLEKGSVSWLGAHPGLDGLIAKAELAEKEAALAQAAGGKSGNVTQDGPGDAPPASTQETPFRIQSLLPAHDVKARTPAPKAAADEHPHH